MTNILLVAAGGALGAVARYGLGSLLTPLSDRPALPWGTLAVNLVGCFLIGAAFGVAEGREAPSELVRVFFMVGILGGFTTFSAFGLETATLLRSGAHGLASANIVLQVLGGLAAVWAGWAMLR